MIYTTIEDIQRYLVSLDPSAPDEGDLWVARRSEDRERRVDYTLHPPRISVRGYLQRHLGYLWLDNISSDLIQECIAWEDDSSKVPSFFDLLTRGEGPVFCYIKQKQKDALDDHYDALVEEARQRNEDLVISRFSARAILDDLTYLLANRDIFDLQEERQASLAANIELLMSRLGDLDG